jgi:uncharacterized protein YndB with AHSA1/START domain
MTEQREPIRRNVVVRCTSERAFQIFADEMDTWWPLKTHSRAASEFEGEDVEVERVEFQGRAGGQVIEHMSNGRALPWAEVLVWDPPRRFVLAWKPHGRPQPPTELEVTFSAQGAETLVELVHRGWERLVEDIGEAYEGYATGWIETLRRFAATADEGTKSYSR